jgi:hypothetical protein
MTFPSQIPTRRERLRFSGFKANRTPNGRISVEVELEWNEGVRFTGQSEGQSGELSDLRVSAQAAITALSRFADGGIQFELLGVKATRAFDANIIIVSVAMRGPDGGRRLIGCVIAEDDVLRGAVVAVLSATNRVMGNFVNTREAASS